MASAARSPKRMAQPQDRSALPKDTRTSDEKRQDAMDHACRLVALRPRSEKELRQRLVGRIAPEVLDQVIARLIELGLLNDGLFAASWTESRDRTAPRSRRLIAMELKQKGITQEVAVASAAVVDERQAAYRAAARRAASMQGARYEEFRRRIGGFLQRRGFSFEVIEETLRRLWLESAPSRDAPGRAAAAENEP